MNTLRTVLLVGLCSLAITAGAQTQPDNTKANKGDGKPGAVTADQQKMNANDTDLTRNIRKSIMADKSLSTYAHNVKIVSQNGLVTLRGPVKTDEEKKSVVDKATAIAGANKVTDELTVKQ